MSYNKKKTTRLNDNHLCINTTNTRCIQIQIFIAILMDRVYITDIRFGLFNCVITYFLVGAQLFQRHSLL